MEQMQRDLETGKAAANLMSQFINNGMVQQTGEHEVTVPHPDGDKVFVAFQNDWRLLIVMWNVWTMMVTFEEERCPLNNQQGIFTSVD